MMKKLFNVGIVLILALSSIGSALAQEKARKEGPAGFSKSVAEKSVEAANAGEAKGKVKADEKKQGSPNPNIWRMGGLITAVDPQTKTISIHQETVHHDRVMKLKVSEKVAKELLNLKTGDVVNVWVTGKVITVLNKVT
jgi:hypothetical protein